MNIGKAFKEKFSGKANINLDNLTEAGNANLVSVPNYNAGIAIASGAVMPENGVIIGVHNFSDGGYRSLTINGVCLFNTRTGASYLNSQSAGMNMRFAKVTPLVFKLCGDGILSV